MDSVKGKAILTITKTGSEHVPFEVEVDSITCDSDDYEPTEDFQLLETDTLPLPDAAYELGDGETVAVEVDYEWSYFYDDYFREWDCDLEYHSQKVVKQIQIPKVIT